MERINIIGAGLAGLSAAITLAERDVACRLISAQSSERAQSVLAEGGINAALDLMGEGDTPAEHFADTMRGGVELADPETVRRLTEAAPALVRRLSALGVPFQMEGDALVQRSFGGQKKKRTAYAKSSTGKAIMSALIDETRKYEAKGLVERYSHHEFIGFVLREGRCVGADILDTYTDTGLRFSGPVILCCGGLNGFFPGATTGTTQNTGNAAAIAFAAGVPFGNLEMIQYHPTTAAIAGKRMLISEAARGEGGRLFIRRGGRPWYYMEELSPELGNLAPRDVISRESVKVLAMPECGRQIYLDLTGLSGEIWRRRLPDLRQEIRHYLAIDPAKEPVPVSPGIHYFMGGLAVDAVHRTDMPGLFAAGECACQYHGANRLGGNSMLGAIYGGRTAALSAADCRAADGADTAVPVSLSAQRRRELSVSAAFSERLGAILLSGLGIVRTEETILAALGELEELLTKERTEMERSRARLGKAMLLSALERRESRGAQYRTDYPERNDALYQKTTVAACRGDGEIRVTFEPISRKGAEP